MNEVLPLPASASTIASAAPRCPALAVLMVTSASRAAAAARRHRRACRAPAYAAPCKRAPALPSAPARSPLAGRDQRRGHRSADIAAGAGDEDFHEACPTAAIER